MTQSNDDDDIQILVGYGSYGCGTQLYVTPDSQVVGRVHPDDTKFLAALFRDLADAVESKSFVA